MRVKFLSVARVFPGLQCDVDLPNEPVGLESIQELAKLDRSPGPAFRYIDKEMKYNNTSFFLSILTLISAFVGSDLLWNIP